MQKNILIFLFLATSIFSQNNKELYKYIFHQDVLNNNEILENSVEFSRLEAKLNPELLYYRINYINNVYGHNNIDKSTNGFNELMEARRKYIEQRNKWLQKQIKTTNKNYNSNRHHSSIKNFFEDLTIENTEQKEINKIEVDQNLINFYVVFYYSKGKVNKYENNTDYKDLRTQYETKVINDIKNIEKALKSNRDIETDDIYEKIENNIFILSTYLEDIDYPEIMFLQKKKEFNINNLNKISFWINYIFENSSDKTKPISIRQDIKSTFQLGEIRFDYLLNFEISYKIFLKREVDYFSYISLGFLYSKVNTTINLIESPQYVRHTVSDYGNTKVFEFYDIKKIEASKINNDRFGINLSTPIWIFKPKITLDIGLSFSYQNLGYNKNALYDYRKIKSYYRDDGYFNYSEELENIQNVEEKYKVDDFSYQLLPLISLNVWNMFDLIDLRVLSSINYLKAGVAISF